MNHLNTWRRLMAIATILLTTTGALYGQAQSGNLYGTVSGADGGALPGVTVTLGGVGAEQRQVTDEKGQFRFLGLSPSSYELQASLDGFSTVRYPNVVISVNRNATVEVQLTAAVEETITVTSESPLLDSRKITSGSTVSQIELESIPSARDPWAVLQTVPGVLTDRINVGGNESGQQSNYSGPGANGTDQVWAVDGVVITDMSAIGSSPTYYNYDAFEEMQVTTGGSDASLATSGVALNMVTKRGTNEWRGSGRFIKADESWQSSLEINESELGPDQDAFSQGNRIVSVEDSGIEFGGPIVQDKLWIWANYGKNEIDLLTIDDVSDFTELEDYGAKLNGQLAASNSLVLFYNYGDKIKIGRDASPTRTQPTTFNQTGPTDIWKIEDTHVFSSSFFLTGMASYVGGGFQLTPQGDYINGVNAFIDLDGVWQNNYLHHETGRPQDQAKLDGNYFFNTGTVSHDLKFGVGLRKVGLTSNTVWPGEGAGGVPGYRADGFYGAPVIAVVRNGLQDAEQEYKSAYAQDTLTFGNLTLNVGLRYDEQSGNFSSVTLPGVPGLEVVNGEPLFPTATTTSGDQGFTWQDITPRLGLTYALGGENKTLLRASYARFAEQLNSAATFTSPAAGGYSYFNYDDANGDGLITVPELDLATGVLFTNGFDPLGQFDPDQHDPNYEAALTDELILGVEHALLPEFVIGASLTFRNIHNLQEDERLVQDTLADGSLGPLRQATRADYAASPAPICVTTQGTPVSGRCADFHGLVDGVVDNGGVFRTNGDREQNYLGYTAHFTKRLSNRWMMRGNVTFQDWEQDVPLSEQQDPNNYLGGANQDGARYIEGSGTASGTKSGVYITPGFSYSLTGMYQVAPERSWGFNVSAALNGREGYAVPYFVRLNNAFETGHAFLSLTSDTDEFTLDDTNIVDLRVEKEFTMKGFGATVGLELFNALNESNVMQRQHRTNIGTTDNVLEILSPRIWRLGVRLRFN